MAVKKILFRLRVAKGWTTRISKRESENEREKVQENEQMSKKNVYRVDAKEKDTRQQRVNRMQVYLSLWH